MEQEALAGVSPKNLSSTLLSEAFGSQNYGTQALQGGPKEISRALR